MSSMFTVSEGATDEDKKLLVVTNDERIKGYDFEGSNRIPSKITLNSNGGTFTGDVESVQSQGRFCITTDEYADVEQTIKGEIESLGEPTKEGYIFAGWKIAGNPTSTLDKFNATYRAVWRTGTEKDVVYTGFTGGTSSSGEGTVDSPYNRFEDAVANVADGGTIYIKAERFAQLNDVGNNMPFVIDKNVTIKPVDGTSNAVLSVRSAGIMLDADVTFENITLEFANRYHDSIFANGNTLNLINVSHTSGTREIDLFAGGLYMGGTQIGTSGGKGVINIELNDGFGVNSKSTFGNIYAGSMNGAFNGDAVINVTRTGSQDLKIGAIKASGASETVVGDNFFDGEEPAPPTANPESFKMHGDVVVNLNEYQVSVDGTTGTGSKTNVTATSEYIKSLELKNVDHLTVDGKIKAVYEGTDTTIPNVTVKDGSTLDLSEAGSEVTIGNYNGDGIVVLSKDGRLNFANPMNSNIQFQTEGGFGDESGEVNEDHVYITTPNTDAVISFTPHFSQSQLQLVARETGSVVEWVIEEAALELVDIKGLIVENNSKTMTYDEINGDENFAMTSFQVRLETDEDLTTKLVDLNEYPFEITVNGHEAVQREDMMDYFVEELGLSIYFNTETFEYDHELIIAGSDVDGNPTPIQVGEYEINVSHKENVGFTSYLTVTGDVEDGGDGELPPVDGDVTPEQPPVVEPPVEDMPEEKPPVEDGDETPPADGGDQDPQPPVEDETQKPQPPVEDGEDTEQPDSPDNPEEDGNEGEVQPPVDEGDTEQQPPEEEKPVTPQPPSSGGTATPPFVGGMGGMITPDNSDAPSEDNSDDEDVNVPSEDDNSNNVEDNDTVVGGASSELIDVSGHWAEKAIEYVVNNGIFNGVTAEEFKPNAKMTRAMFVTVLHRLSGAEDMTRESPFIDVKEGAYYEEAVKWAYNSEIVKGGGLAYKFDPNKEITRQEIAVMFDRYLQHMNVELPSEESGEFADEHLISGWASDSVKRIYGTSIMTGKEGNQFDPLSPATRGEVATIIYRLMNK